MGPPLSRIVRDLNNEQNFLTRVQAISKLSWYTEAETTDLLLTALRDPYFRVREEAALALARIYDPRVVPPLIAAVTDIPSVRDAALVALEARMLTPELQQQIAANLDSYSFYSRRKELKEDFLIDTAAEALKDDDFLVRETAVEALRGVDAEQAFLCFLDACNDPFISVREKAGQSIRLYEGPLSVELLTEALSTLDWHLFENVLFMLKRRAYTHLEEVLVNLLQHDNYIIRRRARSGLSHIKDKPTLSILLQSLKDWDGEDKSIPAFVITQFYREGREKLVTYFAEAMHTLIGSIVERDWPTGIEALHRLADQEEWRHLAFFATEDLDRRNLHDIGNVLDRSYGIQQKNADEYLCTRHLARFTLYNTRGNKYFGCRICKETHESIKASEVVAVLDSAMTEDRCRKEDSFRINWLSTRQHMDFDAVEIGICSEDSITDFCIEMGNDTDDFRVKRYKKTPCYIQKNVSLSNETTNLIHRQFKRVVPL